MSFLKLTKEFLADRLYDACQDRSATADEALENFVTPAFDSNLMIESKKEELLNLIRGYKNSGVGLDKTCEDILVWLYGDEEATSPYDFDFPITLKNKEPKNLKQVSDSLTEHIKKLMDQRK